MYLVNKILFDIGIFILFFLCILALTSTEVYGQINSTNIIENEVANPSTPSGNLHIDVTIEGTFYDDNLNGGNGDDIIFGMEGNDILNGDSGDDLLLGNSGDDILSGEDGNDELEGGEGSDQLDGGIGEDKLIGGKGPDKYICDKKDSIIGFDSTEGDSKEGMCKIKDEGLSSDNNFEGNKQKDKKTESKRKIFPN